MIPEQEVFPLKNNNRTAIRRLSSRSLKNNSIRNLFAICAIILTSMLFTAVFSLFSGIIQASEENTMREVGTRAHAGLKNATRQQYEQAAADPSVKKCNYNIFIGFAENIQKRQAEIRFMPFEEALPDYFISLAEGHMPKAEDEILVDTYILDELKVPHTLGSKVTLTFQFMGELVEKEFQVCGYYNGDAISHASELFLSERFWLQLKGSRTEADFAAWGKEHPNENGQGLLSVNLTFSNASHLEDKVHFLGPKSHTDLRAIYASADLFAAPSVTAKNGDVEGFGLVILEAMASGLPVIASNSGGITDIITDGENGLLAQERDSRQIASHIDRLIHSPALSEKLSRASLETAAHFDYTVIAQKYRDMIEDSCR